jgi:hypothetical protein
MGPSGVCEFPSDLRQRVLRIIPASTATSTSRNSVPAPYHDYRAQLREINRAIGIISYEEMKPLNLKAALILITIGSVLLIISVTPYQGGMICTLTADACAQVAAQAAQAAAIQFFEFFFSGVALMSIAAIFLVMGRNKQTSPPTIRP